MPASPYDATKIGSHSSKSPLNGLTFYTTQNAGRKYNPSVIYKLTMNYPGFTAANAGRKLNVGHSQFSHYAYDDVFGYAHAVYQSDGKIVGQVTDGVSPIPGVYVRVYYRKTGILLGQTLTNATGNFTLFGVSRSKIGQYFVVAFDPAGGPTLNAQIFDYLTPVQV